MQIARDTRGGQALSVLTVDSRVPDELLAEVAAAISATTMGAIVVVYLQFRQRMRLRQCGMPPSGA